MKYILLILTPLLIISCSSGHINSLDDFLIARKGLNIERFKNNVNSNLNGSMEFTLNGNSYTVLAYPITTNYQRTQNGDTVVHTYFQSNYFFLFENDELKYWGFLYELKRIDNPELNELAKKIESRLQ